MFKIIIILSFLSFHFRVFAQEAPIIDDNSNLKILSHENFNSLQKIFLCSDSISAHNHSFGNVFGQALVGSLCAAGFAFLPFNAMSSTLGGKDQVNAASAILTLAWYTFGAAVGVYWIAKSENPELSFWGTVGSSVIGAGVGSGLVAILSSGNDTPPTPGVVLAALCPIISSMIYASVISEWPSDSQNIALQKNILAHKDLFQYSKIFDLELLRIKL